MNLLENSQYEGRAIADVGRAAREKFAVIRPKAEQNLDLYSAYLDV